MSNSSCSNLIIYLLEKKSEKNIFAHFYILSDISALQFYRISDVECTLVRVEGIDHWLLATIEITLYNGTLV